MLPVHSRPDTYRLSIKTAIGLSLKSIHKFFPSSQKKSLSETSSPQVVWIICVGTHGRPPKLLFYLCLISSYMIIWQWFIFSTWPLYLFTFFWRSAFMQQVERPVIHEQSHREVKAFRDFSTLFFPQQLLGLRAGVSLFHTRILIYLIFFYV